MRANEIAKLLATNAETVVTMLLPSGKRKAHEWECGDLNGASGESLKIRLTGSKAGVWSDFSSGESGDLIGLWMAVKGLSLKQACDEAKDYLGIKEQSDIKPKPLYNRPSKAGMSALSQTHLDWLTNDRRISPDAIRAYKIASKGDYIVFPYIRSGELVGCKYRKLPKSFMQEVGCEPSLFGWQALNPNVRKVLICEGECFPPETQVMTKSGWVAFGDYVDGEVAQYNNGAIEWAEPIAKIEKQFKGNLLRYETKGYVSVTTPDHNLVSIDFKGREYKHKAIDGATSDGHSIPRVGMLGGVGINLTDSQIKLCIAVSADATVDVRKNSGNKLGKEPRYVRFGLKKQRKIDRLRELLTDCGICASDTTIKNDYQSICFAIPDWVVGRMLPWSWIADATLEQRELILSEIVLWDGNFVKGRNQTEYSSKHIENAEWVQAISHSTGRVSSIKPRTNQYGSWFSVSILHGKKTTSWQSLKGHAKQIPYDGAVHCLQVPSGALVVRHDMKITISGNCDALAWATYGIPALSIPMGAGTGAKQSWIENEFESLSCFDTIYLSMDMDSAGQSCVDEIVARLGSERVRVVKLPEKDANACLMAGIAPEALQEVLDASKSLDPKELRDSQSFEEAVMAESSRKDDGMILPWLNTADDIKLRDGELSIWAGINGHGKSNIIDNVVVDISITQGVKVLACSLEYRMAKWLHRLSTIACGIANPTDDFRRTCYKRLAENLMVFDVPQSAKARRIMEVFRYSAKRYGTKFFLIDNLTKCGFADDDYSGQKAFIEELSDFARVENVHVAVVMHMRKGEGSEEKPSGKFGLKGSGGIADMASTIIEVWRNKKKERAVAKAMQDNTVTELADAPDTFLFVHKQRETGIEPIIALWFNQGTLQFLPSPHHKPSTIGGIRKIND